MFIGQYDHSIDDKSRLTLPARFREALADGVVLSKGLDGSVDVYPKDAWQTTIAERIGGLDPLSSEARTLQRLFFGAARELGLGKHVDGPAEEISDDHLRFREVGIPVLDLIDLQFGQGRNWPLGAALSITLLVIVTLALLVYVRNAGKSGGGHGH